ncbi:hypothetical protein L7F22_005372 [Adiantum nelumboides]|nr:hypothetical protein [Adiantum nelumboides]
MDVVPEPLLGKTVAVTGERKKKAPKVLEPLSSKTVQVSVRVYLWVSICRSIVRVLTGFEDCNALGPRCSSVSGCTSRAVSRCCFKEGSKGPKSDPTNKTGFEEGNAFEDRCSSVDGCTSRIVPRCCFEEGSKGPKGPKGDPTNKTGLKIATLAGQDALLSSDVPQEPCQDASSKKAPAPMEAQPTKQVGEMPEFICQFPKCLGFVSARVSLAVKCSQDMIVYEGSGPLKVQKSGQAKKLSGSACFEPPKTQVNKIKAKANVKEKEGTAVPEQHNVRRLKRMKEVGVRGHRTQLYYFNRVYVLVTKSSGESSGGSDDGGDEDDGSSQDGDGDDDFYDASNGDANDDDGGSDISGGGDDKADGEDDGTDDEDDGGGSGKGDSESVSEQDDAQDVSSDEDEVQEILSSPASIFA